VTRGRVVTRSILFASLLVSSLGVALVPSGAASTARTSSSQSAQYPVGVASATEPSGEAPPSPDSLPGYRETYVQDFLGATLPPRWDIFTGVPGGAPDGHFGISHVKFSAGLLELLTYRNPNYGNRWVTGGICQCGHAQKYGAYFVRSRVTGAGPNEVELLWPLTNRWPPEIDFNETGGVITGTTSSVHFNANNTIVRRTVTADMRRWHTWGVIWTPTLITYTLDGRVWGQYDEPQNIPSVPMTLDFEQRTLCPLHRQCPSSQENMYVDWVAEFTK
jgi:beta-glucanase (GH16 family)